jgi:hypothetical protein
VRRPWAPSDRRRLSDRKHAVDGIGIRVLGTTWEGKRKEKSKFMKSTEKMWIPQKIEWWECMVRHTKRGKGGREKERNTSTSTRTVGAGHCKSKRADLIVSSAIPIPLAYVSTRKSRRNKEQRKKK